MTLVLDSGALIALERNDRAMWRRLKAAQLQATVPLTHGGVIGQAWRGKGPRQALLVKALAAIDVRPLDEALGRAAGELLAAAKRRDVIDAALVLLADDGDEIVTSDADDIEPLARASGRHVEIVSA
ncbi:MAG: PIN domain nuclease [Acidobacteria bacterium]|nr:PIN domain nuclease [Acidobacteriota bacterium]